MKFFSASWLRNFSLLLLIAFAALVAWFVVDAAAHRDLPCALCAVSVALPFALVAVKPQIAVRLWAAVSDLAYAGVMFFCYRHGLVQFADDPTKPANAGGADELASLAQQLLTCVSGVRDQINTTLKGFPPLEQVEASQELSYSLRCMTSYANQLMQFSDNLSNKISEYTTKARAMAEANAEASILAKGTYILKADAELAQNTALGNLKTQLQSNFEAERQKEATVKTRRAELSADAELVKKLPAAAIAHINAEVLAGDSYKTDVLKYVPRIERITAAGVSANAETDLLVELMSLPLDEASETVAATRCDSVKKLIAASASRAGSSGSGSVTSSAERQPIPTGGTSAATGPKRIF